MEPSLEQSLAFLRRHQVLQDLTAEEMALLLRLTTRREFPPGATVIQEGEPGESMFLLCAGQVEVSKRLLLEISEDAPREKVMTRLSAEVGVVLGEMAVIDKEVRSATVTALTPCCMLELSRSNFQEILQTHPVMGVKILYGLAKLLCQRLRQSGEEIIKLTTALAIALEA